MVIRTAFNPLGPAPRSERMTAPRSGPGKHFIAGQGRSACTSPTPIAGNGAYLR
jgi:hypothetical protein